MKCTISGTQVRAHGGYIYARKGRTCLASVQRPDLRSAYCSAECQDECKDGQNGRAAQ